MVAASTLPLSSAYKTSVFSEINPAPLCFFLNLKSSLWKGPLRVKITKQKSLIRFWATSVSILVHVHNKVIFSHKLLK